MPSVITALPRRTRWAHVPSAAADPDASIAAAAIPGPIRRDGAYQG
jgi:hypothetical protein